MQQKLQIARQSSCKIIGALRKRAANEARTRDPQLGKLMLYQLSYCRILLCLIGANIQLFFGYSKCFVKVFQPRNMGRQRHGTTIKS